MKENYEQLNIEVVAFKTADVLTASAEEKEIELTDIPAVEAVKENKK